MAGSVSTASSETAAATPGSTERTSKDGDRKANPTTQHPDLDFFDQHGELQRTLSRSATRNSTRTTATQDPTGEGFDYKTHLQHALRKGDREGVLRRELEIGRAHV